MAFDRQAALRIALPIGTFVTAAALHLTGRPFEHLPQFVGMVLGVIGVAVVFVTVFVVLHQAEKVAHRTGEPYGTLILTFSVTAIEVSVILSMMLHGENNPTLARESVFSTVMIVCAGVVGLCLTLGGLRHRQQEIKRQGTNAFLPALIALTILTLVLPDFTLAGEPGVFSPVQLAFVSMLSVLLYGSFVYAQMASHRDDFVDERLAEIEYVNHAHERPSVWLNVLLLVVGLVGIVLMTELVAGGIEDKLVELQVGQADAIVGAFIATLVLMPESAAAVRAALNNELQRSLNIALGSACATIGMTIPAVAVASLITGRGLTLGLNAGDTVLLVLALSISVVSFGTGRTTVMTGLVHLVVFFAYLFLIVVP